MAGPVPGCKRLVIMTVAKPHCENHLISRDGGDSSLPIVRPHSGEGDDNAGISPY